MRSSSSTHRRLGLAIPLALIIIATLATASWALSAKVSDQWLVQHSRLIIIGKVTRQWFGDCPNGHICTYSKVSVQSTLKGDTPNSELTVWYFGGIKGDIGLAVEDMPKLSTGETVLLFLSPKGEGYWINGAFQGKLTIKDDMVLERGIPLVEFIENIYRIIDNN